MFIFITNNIYKFCSIQIYNKIFDKIIINFIKCIHLIIEQLLLLINFINSASDKKSFSNNNIRNIYFNFTVSASLQCDRYSEKTQCEYGNGIN